MAIPPTKSQVFIEVQEGSSFTWLRPGNTHHSHNISFTQWLHHSVEHCDESRKPSNTLQSHPRSCRQTISYNFPSLWTLIFSYSIFNVSACTAKMCPWAGDDMSSQIYWWDDFIGVFFWPGGLRDPSGGWARWAGYPASAFQWHLPFFCLSYMCCLWAVFVVYCQKMLCYKQL